MAAMASAVSAPTYFTNRPTPSCQSGIQKKKYGAGIWKNVAPASKAAQIYKIYNRNTPLCLLGSYTTLIKHYSSVIQKSLMSFLFILKPIQKQ